MDDKKNIRSWQVLELPPTATLAEAKQAYLRLKRLFTEENPTLSPISQEFKEKREKILEEIEEAYRNILDFFRVEPGKEAPSPPARPAEAVNYMQNSSLSGPILKQAREKMGIPLAEIHRRTKIRLEQLRNIEEERFEALPDEVYLKAQVRQIASYLCFPDPDRVVSSYLKRYGEWKKLQSEHKEKEP